MPRLPIKRGIRLRILLTQIEMQLEELRLPIRILQVEEPHFHLQLIKVARLFKVKVHFQLMQQEMHVLLFHLYNLLLIKIMQGEDILLTQRILLLEMLEEDTLLTHVSQAHIRITQEEDILL